MHWPPHRGFRSGAAGTKTLAHKAPRRLAGAENPTALYPRFVRGPSRRNGGAKGSTENDSVMNNVKGQQRQQTESPYANGISGGWVKNDNGKNGQEDGLRNNQRNTYQHVILTFV